LIRDASFSVQSGDRIGLVGRNGAGKTTLMRVLMGILQPFEGHRSPLRAGSATSPRRRPCPTSSTADATALERILMAREIGAMQRRIEEARVRLHDLDR
jgi:ATPase subunit of ABC transporter with duplicated ATPase domains